MDTPGWIEELKVLFSAFDVFFVAMHCDRDELIRREAKRGDRPAGSARQDFETIHIGREYDLELQSANGLEHNLSELHTSWRSGVRRSEFVSG